MITCPCCGGRGEIEERAPVPMSALQFKIYDTVRRSMYGIGGEMLTDQVYSDRRDGGPETANGVVRTVIVRINRKLLPVGQRIVGTSKGNGGSVYKLQRLA